MRNLKNILTGLVVSVATTLMAANGPAPQGAFAVGATNNGATIPIAWCTISANSQNGGVPVVTEINAGCNTNTVTQQLGTATNGYVGAVVAWRIVDKTSANFTNTTTSIPVAATNSFASGDLVLIRHLATDDYERISLTTATSGTNLTALAAPSETVAVGDLIYRLSATNAPVLMVANTTNIVSGNRILCGQKGLPLFLSVQGLSAAVIFSASGYYESDRPTSPLSP